MQAQHSDEGEIELTDKQAQRWYKKGRQRLEKMLHVDYWMKKIINQDIYTNEVQRLSIKHMNKVRRNRKKVLAVDHSDETVESDDSIREIGNHDCEHHECHAV